MALLISCFFFIFQKICGKINIQMLYIGRIVRFFLVHIVLKFSYRPKKLCLIILDFIALDRYTGRTSLTITFIPCRGSF